VFVEKLELFGFKSFPNRTEIPLARGITAIVGPNGCGKSNISDALRWVLGEQNARTLRGERIQDVIFKGTGSAKPLGLAEVILSVSNDDGVLPLEYTHVAVARRVFRSGESEFAINKIPCRLKDIRDLFSGTGLGSHGYSVIERDMIDQVLSDKDDARRFLFEEASGIIRYKQRRKESERRLEGVEQDLTRIEDMIREIERMVRSLARQAGKVRRFKRLKEQLGRYEVRQAWEKWSELRDRSLSSEESHRRREAERADLSSRVAALDARREALRLQLLELGDHSNEAQRAMESADRAVSSAREEVKLLQARQEAWVGERQDLAARLARYRERLAVVGEELARLEPRRGELEALHGEAAAAVEEAAAARAEAEQALREVRLRLAQAQQLNLDLSARRSGARQDLESKRERRAAAAAKHAALAERAEQFAARQEQVRRDASEAEQRHADLEGRLAELSAELAGVAGERGRAGERQRELLRQRAEVDGRRAGVASRLGLLEEQHQRHEGFDAGVRYLLEEKIPGLVGVVGEQVRLRAGSELLGRAVLGDRVQWVLVASEADALEGIERLRGRGLGGVTFFPLREASPVAEAENIAALEPLFETAPEARPFLAWLAATTRLAGGVEEARRSMQEGAAETADRAITPQGLVFCRNRTVHLAAEESGEVEILRREAEIPQLQALVAKAGEESRALDEEQAEAARQEAYLTGRAASLEAEMAALEKERREISEVRGAARTELAMVREEASHIGQEQASLRLEMDGLEEEILRLQDEVRLSEDDTTDAHHRFEELHERAEEQEALKDERVRHQAEREMEALRRRNELASCEAQLQSLRREEDELTRSAEEAESRLAERGRDAEEAASRILRIEEGMGGLEEDLAARQGALADVRGRHQKAQDALFALDAELREVRGNFDALVQTLHEQDVERLQWSHQAEQLSERIREEHGVDLASYAPPPEPEETNQEDRAGRMAALKRTLEAAGNLNFLAEEEYRTQRERLDFHQQQAHDLKTAREDLLEAIRRINETAGQMFQETFQVVQENFLKTFDQLFPGGEASLSLLGSDPLEGDIEIAARPRGKRLESIRLLSSGERALTAIALLFAIYLAKPSPVCLLDEVDAPLDDANLERFNVLVRHFSARTQFICITHNKKTMEMADRLFGVTMEEPGISKIVSVELDAIPATAGPEQERIDAAATAGAEQDRIDAAATTGPEQDRIDAVSTAGE